MTTDTENIDFLLQMREKSKILVKKSKRKFQEGISVLLLFSYNEIKFEICREKSRN